ncbi:MAG: YdcF family protein [Bacteroidota bacterium]
MKTAWMKIKDGLKRFFHRKRLIRYAVYFSILLAVYLCRFPILRYMGNRLITEDELKKTEYCFVLGGASYERGKEAAKLYKDGFASTFVCLGENEPELLKITGDTLMESELSVLCLEKCGIPPGQCIAIKKTTSTREEIAAIHEFCEEKSINEFIIVSSKFHLRRIRKEVDKVFDEEKYSVILHGAPATNYNEEEWWKYEQGLIAVNNEYMKLFWYWWTD